MTICVLPTVTEPKAKAISGFFGCTRLLMPYQHCVPFLQVFGALRLFHVEQPSLFFRMANMEPCEAVGVGLDPGSVNWCQVWAPSVDRNTPFEGPAAGVPLTFPMAA